MAEKKFDFKSHHPVYKDGMLQAYRVKPYIRLREGEAPPIIVQSGLFYSDEGGTIDEVDLPPWVHDKLRQLSPDARESVGLARKMDAKPHPSLSKKS